MAHFEELSGIIYYHLCGGVISYLITLLNKTPAPAALEDSDKGLLAAIVVFQGPIITTHTGWEQKFPAFARKRPRFEGRSEFKSDFYQVAV